MQAVTISAWFTADIPVSAGPDKYGSLPGMVLAIDQNNGERTITATKVSLQTVKPKDIAPPTKGEKMSDTDYRAMMREWMKKNGGGMRRMQRN